MSAGLLKRLGYDLADALARNVVLLTDLLQGVLALAADPALIYNLVIKQQASYIRRFVARVNSETLAFWTVHRSWAAVAPVIVLVYQVIKGWRGASTVVSTVVGLALAVFGTVLINIVRCPRLLDAERARDLAAADAEIGRLQRELDLLKADPKLTLQELRIRKAIEKALPALSPDERRVYLMLLDRSGEATRPQLRVDNLSDSALADVLMKGQRIGFLEARDDQQSGNQLWKINPVFRTQLGILLG